MQSSLVYYTMGRLSTRMFHEEDNSAYAMAGLPYCAIRVERDALLASTIAQIQRKADASLLKPLKVRGFYLFVRLFILLCGGWQPRRVGAVGGW